MHSRDRGYHRSMITKEIRSRWEAEAQAWAMEQDADVDAAAAVAGARRLVDAILGARPAASSTRC